MQLKQTLDSRIPITDGDMLYAFHHLIVHIAQSFKPDLILLFTGYDSLIGDPIGMLSLSPFSFIILRKCLELAFPRILWLD